MRNLPFKATLLGAAIALASNAAGFSAVANTFEIEHLPQVHFHIALH